jgi:hypothetical protein
VLEPELNVDNTTWLTAAEGADKQIFLEACLLYGEMYEHASLCGRIYVFKYSSIQQ